MSMQGHNWCFTVNNYTAEEIVAVKSLEYKYLVIGFEVGEEGTPHLQCYVELTNRRYSTLTVLRRTNEE